MAMKWRRFRILFDVAFPPQEQPEEETDPGFDPVKDWAKLTGKSVQEAGPPIDLADYAAQQGHL